MGANNLLFSFLCFFSSISLLMMWGEGRSGLFGKLFSSDFLAVAGESHIMGIYLRENTAKLSLLLS